MLNHEIYVGNFIKLKNSIYSYGQKAFLADNKINLIDGIVYVEAISYDFGSNLKGTVCFTIIDKDLTTSYAVINEKRVDEFFEIID